MRHEGREGAKEWCRETEMTVRGERTWAHLLPALVHSHCGRRHKGEMNTEEEEEEEEEVVVVVEAYKHL